MTRDDAETAYRGEPNERPAKEHRPETQSAVERNRRKRPIERLGPQCGEYLLGAQSGEERTADPESPGARINRHAGGHIWPTGGNPLMILHLASVGGWIYFAIGVFVALIMTIGNGFSFWVTDQGFQSFAIILGFPGAIGLVSSLLIRRAPGLGNRGNIVFRRTDGRIVTPSKISESKLYFADFDPYIFERFRGTGATGLKLMLCHRAQSLCLMDPVEEVEDVSAAYIEWELLQQYMDVNLPMPDLPEFEPVRDEDPVTVEWDRRRGRPRCWWRHISREQFRALRDESAEAGRRYPWGKTREQAKAEGWRPSIFSEVQCGEASYDDLMAFLADADPENAERFQTNE